MQLIRKSKGEAPFCQETFYGVLDRDICKDPVKRLNQCLFIAKNNEIKHEHVLPIENSSYK